jgi:ABC-2 type transport system ATP-binding protein
VRALSDHDLDRIVDATSQFATNAPGIDRETAVVAIPVAADMRLIDVMRAIDDAGIDVVDINRRQATLDDVFLTLTSKLEVFA